MNTVAVVSLLAVLTLFPLTSELEELAGLRSAIACSTELEDQWPILSVYTNYNKMSSNGVP